MEIKIYPYAQIKEYFKEPFSITLETDATVNTLKAALSKLKPEAAGIIDKCRFAVRESIVENTIVLQEQDTVHVIPPSSGG
jgi:sulfur-carrier protein